MSHAMLFWWGFSIKLHCWHLYACWSRKLGRELRLFRKKAMKTGAKIVNSPIAFRCACCNQPRTSFTWSGTNPYCARCWRRIWSVR